MTIHRAWADSQGNGGGGGAGAAATAAVDGDGASGGVSSSNTSYVPSLLHGPLLPELAQLPWLDGLLVTLYTVAVTAGIPADWAVAGAFPSLKQ